MVGLSRDWLHYLSTGPFCPWKESIWFLILFATILIVLSPKKGKPKATKGSIARLARHLSLRMSLILMICTILSA